MTPESLTACRALGIWIWDSNGGSLCKIVCMLSTANGQVLEDSAHEVDTRNSNERPVSSTDRNEARRLRGNGISRHRTSGLEILGRIEKLEFFKELVEMIFNWRNLCAA